MFNSTRTVAVLLAITTVIGFGIAPMAAVAAPSENTNTAHQLEGTQLDGSGLSTQANSTGPFPQEVCTDLLGMMHEQAPYDMIIWVDDLPESVPRDVPNKNQLPEQLRPPGIPWSVVTPQSVGGIIVGATPNQCDVFNPNDPPYDPIQDSDDNFAPDGGGDVQQGETGEVLFIVNGTLDNTSQGPSVEGTAGLDLAENGSLAPDATLNDGEKKYALDPELKYWSDGTTYFDNDVYVFGTRLGTVMDCTGPECTFSTRGLPNFVDYPSFPSHTDSDPDAGSGGDGGAGGGGDSGSENRTDDGTSGNGTDDGTGSTGTDGAGGSSNGGDSGGADGTTGTDDGTGGQAGSSGSGGSGSSGGDGAGGSGSSDGGQAGTSGSGGSGTDGSGGSGTDGSGGSGTDGSNSQQQANQGDDGGNQEAQQAAAADGSGLGVVVAMIVFVLGAAAIAPRD